MFPALFLKEENLSLVMCAWVSTLSVRGASKWCKTAMHRYSMLVSQTCDSVISDLQFHHFSVNFQEMFTAWLGCVSINDDPFWNTNTCTEFQETGSHDLYTCTAIEDLTNASSHIIPATLQIVVAIAITLINRQCHKACTSHDAIMLN